MEITKEPDKILHRKLNNVNEIDAKVKELISGMREAMKSANGVGLAASQVGKDLMIFVIDANLAKENNVPDAYLNPVILEYSNDKNEAEEGCLSLPGFWPIVKRAKKVKLKALDENGAKIKIKARGFLARVYQHEVDHLNGVLIKDKNEKWR